MKTSRIIVGSFGKKSIKGLLDDGTILGVTRLPAGAFHETTYWINGKAVKNKGATNKIFSRNIENFAELIKKL
jgi:hypothetical protein